MSTPNRLYRHIYIYSYIYIETSGPINLKKVIDTTQKRTMSYLYSPQAVSTQSSPQKKSMTTMMMGNNRNKPFPLPPKIATNDHQHHQQHHHDDDVVVDDYMFQLFPEKTSITFLPEEDDLAKRIYGDVKVGGKTASSSSSSSSRATHHRQEKPTMKEGVSGYDFSALIGN